MDLYFLRAYGLSMIRFMRERQTLKMQLLLAFSGLATTVQAVMQLNSEDGGKRKIILVQVPEETDTKSDSNEARFKTICDIR